MKELDTVVLNKDFKEQGLKKGDVGVIVQVYEEGKTFEVEFVTVDGNTVALLTLKASDVRKVARNEILHAREVRSVYSA